MTREKKERIKDLILVVLLMLTILLLYLYLDNKSTIKIQDFLSAPQQQLSEIDVKDVIIPEETAISNGDGSYKKVFCSAEDFKIACRIFASNTKQGNAVITEVSKTQYENALANYESVRFSLSYSIPFADFCNEYGIKRNTGYGSVDSISEISFSAAAKDSVLIADKKNNSYYRFISDMEMDFSNLKRNLEGKLMAENYFLSSSVFGNEDSALIPIDDSIDLLYAKCEAEYNPDMEEKRIEISENIFGKNFDFVRRISDSFNNITYNFGYGQKSLNFNADGIVEYRSEAGTSTSTGFFEDLATVLKMISSTGGYNSSMPYVSLKLKSVKTVDNGRYKTRTFIFGQEYENYPVLGDSEIAIEATVNGGQLTYMKRDTVAISQKYRGDLTNFNAISAIAVSSQDMYSGRLKSINIAYYNKDGDMEPVYAIELTDGQIVVVNIKGEIVE